MKCSEIINRADIRWLEKQKTGDLISRFQLEVEHTTQLLTGILPQMLFQTTKILLFSFVMFYLNVRLTLIYLGMVAIIVVLQFFLSKPVEKVAYKKKEKVSYSNVLAQDILSQKKTIKIFNASSLVRKWYQKRMDEEYKSAIHEQIISAPIQTLGLICGILPILTLCFIGLVFLSNKEITLEEFMTIYFLANTSMIDLLHYATVFTKYRSTYASVKRLSEVLDVPVEEENKKIVYDSGDKDGSLVSFEHVWFSYDSANTEEDKWILKDVSFKINKGEKIAFVGKSGCGKSTILNLLAGFFIPTKGEIKRAGSSYKDMNLSQILTELSIVSQKGFLFADTIKNNILMGKNGKIDEESFRLVCESAQINAFMGNLANGIETQVGERGSALSGGQLQRVMIARALLKDASIFLLDEATSALDAETEKNLQIAIEKNFPDQTRISAAHRLDTVKNADCIYVMKQGRIVEQGTHNELMAFNSYYRKLYEKIGQE